MANLFPPSITRWTDANGNPLNGAKMYFYTTGTSTPLDAYTDGDGMVPAANPEVSDSAGVFAGGTGIFLDTAATYRVKLTNSSGSITYFDVDPVRWAGNANVEEVETSGAVLQGGHTIPVLVGSMVANTTNGPSSGTTESATNDVMIRTLDFDASTDESAQITIPMPKSWDEGTVTVQFIWYAPGGTGNVVWGCAARAFSDDDLFDAAFGTAVTVTDAVTATTDIMESAFTSAITIAGTPAAEDLVIFKFYRDADNGSDTLATDAKLIAVRIKYTVDTGTDT